VPFLLMAAIGWRTASRAMRRMSSGASTRP
jgi:hypothetical protein